MCGTPISAAEAVRVRLGPASLAEGPFPRPVLAGSLPLLLAFDGRGLVAAERACPHEGADLALGRCGGGRLHCPRHLASFDLATGAVSPGWSFRGLRLYPVEVAGDGVWVRLPA
jgi:3-phenylpropionate/trans-cinnamate dioxygenase ferredoxin subunit